MTAIIDGTGSIGAAVGPLVAGALSSNLGWDSVFYALMVAAGLGLLVSSVFNQQMALGVDGFV